GAADRPSPSPRRDRGRRPATLRGRAGAPGAILPFASERRRTFAALAPRTYLRTRIAPGRAMVHLPRYERGGRRMARALRTAATVGLLLLLAACARQVPEGVAHAADTPGFWAGLWHGFVFPFAWIGSLLDPDIAVYAVPNNGGWYDF